MKNLTGFAKATPVFFLLLWAATSLPLSAQTFTLLDTFDGSNGNAPDSSLMQAIDGNLYGTTVYGGISTACNGGCGTIFKITPTGTLTTLYSFCAVGRCHDGSEPFTALVQGTDGNLYGTTNYGGANDDGTVFKITLAGVLTTLHSFNKLGDGSQPQGGLTLGSDGNFYGTTLFGGTNGDGTIFRITPGGSLTTLHTFSNAADGGNPYSAPIQATDGNFYGTAYAGGSGSAGAAYKLTPGGVFTTLYGFCPVSGCADGNGPLAGLIQASNGVLYGTTSRGGNNGAGTVYEITTSGTFTALYSFCSVSGCLDGSESIARLVQGTNEVLYGVTSYGGVNGAGTIFDITTGGTFTTLYSFCSLSDCADGENIQNQPLVQDTNGKFYGLSAVGGASGQGTAYTLSVGLGPFVKTIQTSGAVGASVTILGTSLTGATSVTFNGTSATFSVVSSSEITTTVPAGATTGVVKVFTPSHTLASNTVFRVLP